MLTCYIVEHSGFGRALKDPRFRIRDLQGQISRPPWPIYPSFPMKVLIGMCQLPGATALNMQPRRGVGAVLLREDQYQVVRM